MRIAVIGAGAAGLVTAWLLRRGHGVSVFEREPIVGGHVRTLGGNVPCPALGEARLEAGVVEFEARHFVRLRRLLDLLEVPVLGFPAATTLLPARGPQLLSPGAMDRAGLRGAARIGALRRLVPLARQRRRFLARTDLPADALRGRRLGELLEDAPFDRWMALLVAYAWSVPGGELGDVPAEIAVPMLRTYLDARTWWRVPGGVSRYQARILDDLPGAVHPGVAPRAVRREAATVVLELPDGSRPRFDAVVFATPPDEILGLLVDADEGERARLGPWRPRRVHVLVHDDDGPYRRRGARARTEFDLFEEPPGYNAVLDQVCGGAAGRGWGLAFGLDAEIDPARVLHRQDHQVPRYTVEALATRAALLASQGHRRTWYAGAWLDDGLHEGAVRSAEAVARALGAGDLSG